MTSVIKTNDNNADRAFMLHQEIQQRTIETANSLFELGRLFKTIRDEKLYEFLNYETFEEYLGSPEIQFGRSTVFSFIRVYEQYVLKFEFDLKLLNQIGHRRLQIINPVVDDDPIEWIYKAKELSKSDLINEVKTALGKAPMKPRAEEKEDAYPFTFKDYKDFVKSHKCITCGEKNTEGHHFPKTKGAGGKEEWIIPLCRACHTEYHNDAYDFIFLYKDHIFEYFYNLILKCFTLIKTVEGK